MSTYIIYIHIFADRVEFEIVDHDEMELDTPAWMKDFNHNSHLHHVIMYAGEYDIDHDVLKKSKIAHPSEEVIDFTKTQIVNAKASIKEDGGLHEKGVNAKASIKEDVALYEKGCGTEKGCFGIPRGCIQYATCKLLVTYRKIAPSSATLGKRPTLLMQMKVGYIVISIVLNIKINMF